MKLEVEIRNKIKDFRHTSQEANLFDYNIDDNSKRLYKFKDSVGNKVKIWIFTDRIKIEMPLATSLLFSVNIPDYVCLAKNLVGEITGVGKIFAGNMQEDQILQCIKLIEDDLKILAFENTEGLIIYRNSLQIILKKTRQILPEIEFCQKIKSIIELNYPDKALSSDYSDLPLDLRRLVVQFESWAISDDLERDEKIKESSKKERSILIQEIEPKLGEINSFLHTFGDKPLADGAIMIQNLAEVIIELKFAK